MDNLELIKLNELPRASQVKDTDITLITQDEVSKQLSVPILEQKIIDKLQPKFASKSELDATNSEVSKKINTNEKGVVNGIATLGVDGILTESQRPAVVIDSKIIPIDLQTEYPSVNGVFSPTEVGIYPNFGGLEFTQQELDSSVVYFYYVDGVFSKQVKTSTTTDTIDPINTNAVSSKAVYEWSVKNIGTISELRGTVGKEGQVINLLGYYESGDKEPLVYEWVGQSSIDDGGSIISSIGGHWKAMFEKSIDAKHFGAKDEFNFDNSVFFQNLINYVSLNPNKIILLKGNNTNRFETTETFNLPISTDLICESFLVFNVDNTTKGLVIGNENEYNFRRKLLLRVMKKTLSDWESEDNVGIQLWNLYESNDVNILYVNNFTVGVECIGKAKGCVYNTINIASVLDCRYQLLLNNIDNGWCNENTFNLNRFKNTTTTHRDKSRFGIVIDSKDSNYYNNNNIFNKPSLELISPLGVECSIINIKFGNNNVFNDIRNESNSTGLNGLMVYQIYNQSDGNIINEGYGPTAFISNKIKENGNTIASTSGSSIRGKDTDANSKSVIFDSGFIPLKLSRYNSISTYVKDEMFFSVSGNSNTSKNMTDVSFNNEYILLNSSRGICVSLNTISCKKFTVQRYYSANSPSIGGRLTVRCYDENGILLNNSEKNHVKGSLISTYAYGQFLGWRTGSDAPNSYFEVSPETKRIDIIISGGSSVLYLSSFKILGFDKNTSILNPLNGSSELLCIEKPTNSTFNGTFYKNNVPSSDILGWYFINNIWEEVLAFKKAKSIDENPTIESLIISLKNAGFLE